jgi:hypothetical protein
MLLSAELIFLWLVPSAMNVSKRSAAFRANFAFHPKSQDKFQLWLFFTAMRVLLGSVVFMPEP